ncbi:hypothetical protein SAY87_024178 [Trapa incisa]|uniref:LOB domain-containing protein n=1 Tax=Trapa incisa TaxID=236973 RepID=A0AAN7KZ21_9MYRT|nr:hypothetical protein SAY87_024178 [Trapa incisa]
MAVHGSRCAACKYLRRRCPQDCIFSPHFPSSNPQRFAYVHRIYGASNVGKMLERIALLKLDGFENDQRVPEFERSHVADSLHFEAKCRIEDPVYGCVGFISRLEHQIHSIESEIAMTRALMMMYESSLNRQKGGPSEH